MQIHTTLPQERYSGKERKDNSRVRKLVRWRAEFTRCIAMRSDRTGGNWRFGQYGFLLCPSGYGGMVLKTFYTHPDMYNDKIHSYKHSVSAMCQYSTVTVTVTRNGAKMTFSLAFHKCNQPFKQQDIIYMCQTEGNETQYLV